MEIAQDVARIGRGAALRPLGTRRLEPMIRIAVKNFVAGLSRNAELAADLVNRLASSSRAINRRRFSVTEHSFRGIDDTSRPETKSVTPVSVTKRHPSLGRSARSSPSSVKLSAQTPQTDLYSTAVLLFSFRTRNETTHCATEALLLPIGPLSYNHPAEPFVICLARPAIFRVRSRKSHLGNPLALTYQASWECPLIGSSKR
jgi:hypothetical protein